MHPPEETSRPPAYYKFTILLAYLLSSMLIFAAARGDLWMDEVGSVYFAHEANHAADLFKIHNDNNHLLNTLYLYFMQDFVKTPSLLILYRLLAVASGIGTILLAGRITRRDWGYPESLCSVILIGTSYPLILYFSEARGYAPAMFFSVAAYAVLRHNMVSMRPRLLPVYWGACILGILSHSTFAITWLALLILNLAILIRAAGPARQRWTAFLLHQIPVSVFLTAWYFFFMRGMIINGGSVNQKYEVITEAASLLLGMPSASHLPALALIIVLTIVSSSVAWLIRDRQPGWIFFPAVLILSPFLVIAIMRPAIFYFRYFCIGFPFFYMILAYTGCRIYRGWQKKYRLLLVLAGLMLISGQAVRISPLLTLGRGSYLKALAYILDHSPGPEIRVGSDHDFRNSMMVDFYASLLPRGNALHYIVESKLHEEPPDWLITHEFDVQFQPAQELVLDGFLSFHLVAQYRYAGVSGFNWFVYRRN